MSESGLPIAVASEALATLRRPLLGGPRYLGLVLGGGFVLFAAAIAVFAPIVAPYDPYAQDLTARLIDPVWGPGGSRAHVLGTDQLGRDYLSRLIYGARVSLGIGFAAALLAGVIGVALGVIGGYCGGKVDAVVVYLINVKLALPVVLVALALAALIGGSPVALTLILGLLTWDRYAVAVRSAAQQVTALEFVTAARATGATHARIIVREILPNLTSQIIVIASLDIALIILIEAALSFLGLGVRSPTASWGLMVAEGRALMFFKPYLVAIPGAAIFLLVMAINLAGDGLRDITAPRGR